MAYSLCRQSVARKSPGMQIHSKMQNRSHEIDAHQKGAVIWNPWSSDDEMTFVSEFIWWSQVNYLQFTVRRNWDMVLILLECYRFRMGACCNLSICSNVEITKYLDLSNRCQISSKSRNLWFFCLNLEEKSPCPNFVSTPISANLPIFHIYHIHFHTLGDRSRQSICWCHISLDICVREWVTKCKSRHIFSSIIAKISIYRKSRSIRAGKCQKIH